MTLIKLFVFYNEFSSFATPRMLSFWNITPLSFFTYPYRLSNNVTAPFPFESFPSAIYWWRRHGWKKYQMFPLIEWVWSKKLGWFWVEAKIHLAGWKHRLDYCVRTSQYILHYRRQSNYSCLTKHHKASTFQKPWWRDCSQVRVGLDSGRS